MILGYPGRTERYLTSFGVAQYVEQVYPTRIAIRGRKMDIMLEDMQKDPEIRIKYASKVAGISNYWKYFIGATKALKHLKIIEKKQMLEAQFRKWYSGDEQLKEKYQGVLEKLEEAYKALSAYNVARMYYYEAIRGCEAMYFSRYFRDLEELLAAGEPDQDAIKKRTEQLKASADHFFKNYNRATDNRLTRELLAMYYADVPRDQQPEFMIKEGDKTKGDFVAFTNDAFKTSMFCDQEKLGAFLDEPNLKKLTKDPLYNFMNGFIDAFLALNEGLKDPNNSLAEGKRILMAGLREMFPDKVFYPDANSTMRLTYGKVKDYKPRDAVRYGYYTTLDGVMAKEDPNNWEFVISQRLKDLWKGKDYGQYGENGDLHVCFITDNDITGGNSGSPVLNAKGELLGLAFDGNWEAMSGDINFEPAVQRTIVVDIRYVLFVIDKYAGARNLIDEMTIVQ
jgi:hypothetical protein